MSFKSALKKYLDSRLHAFDNKDTDSHKLTWKEEGWAMLPGISLLVLLIDLTMILVAVLLFPFALLAGIFVSPFLCRCRREKAIWIWWVTWVCLSAILFAPIWMLLDTIRIVVGGIVGPILICHCE